MSGRRRKALSPTLFPFLAVLVCTLGTLILLLALVAQNATDSAQQRAHEQRVAQAEETPDETFGPQRLSAEDANGVLAEASFRVQQLVSFRDQQTGDLEQRRDKLTHLEDHMYRLKDQLKQLQNEVELVLGDQPMDEVEDGSIESLQSQVTKELAALEEVRQQAASKKPRIVIVPHKGPNGTDRRPIYLECDGEGLRIWPEGSVISIDQLVNTSRGANPLDAALRVNRLHAMKHYGDTTPPYPLLVVRPDGVDSFWAARAAMQDWDDQFGYELVPTDVELAFSRPDPALHKRMDSVIQETTLRQQQRRSVGRLASQTHGKRTGSARHLPTLSAAALDRDGRSRGFHDHRENSLPSSGHRSRYAAGASSYSAGSPYGYNAGSSYSSNAARMGAGGMSDSSRGYESGAGADRKLVKEMREAASELRTKRWANENAFSSEPKALASDAPSSTALSTPEASAVGSVFDSPAKRSGDDKRTTGEAFQSPSQAGSESSDPGERSDPGQLFADQPSTNQSSAGQSSATQSSTDEAGRQSSGTGGSQSSGSRSSSDATAMSQGSCNHASPTDSEQDRATQPSVTMDVSRTRPLNRDSKNWALPSREMPVHGNAVVRSIRMQCHADRWVLAATLTNPTDTSFPLSDSNFQQSAFDFGNVIRARVATWGAALPGGHWVPQLEVDVFDGAEHRFDQLRELMSNSGVAIVGRPAK